MVVTEPARPKRPSLVQGVLEHFRKREEVHSRTRDIRNVRSNLGELNLNIADLREKIEKLENIAEKWREKGRFMDIRR